MAGLADWIARRRALRIALIAAFFLLPLLSVVSAALVVMTANLRGWRVAVQDSFFATLVLVALTAVAGGYWAQVGAGAGVTWLVTAALGEIRRAASLTLAVQCTVLLGVLAAVIFALWSRDPQAYWEQVLQDWATRARTAGLEIGPTDLIADAAQVMTGMMAASAVASAMAALFLGSWWAGLGTERSFGEEFQALRMGKVLGVLAGLLGLMFVTPLRTTADDLLLVVAVGFLVQGLSVMHWHGARRGWPRAWPIALYLPMALLPALAAVEMALLALLGLVDNAFSLRRSSGKVV